MNFRQLEIFVTILRCHSFSKAAEELYLTQPTVSAHIGALEQELGTQLIVRSTKAVSPTAAGTVLCEYANALLDLRSRADAALHSYPNTLCATLDIAASTVPAEYVLPQHIAAFCKQHTQVRFAMHEMDSARVVRQVAAGEAVLGFCGSMEEGGNCTFTPIGEDRLVIVTPNRAPYSELPGDDFPTALLRTEPFLLRLPGSGTRREADAYLIHCGIAPGELHTIAYFDSIASIKQGIVQGMGISILSELSALDIAAAGSALLFRNESPFLHRSLYCVQRSGNSLPPAAELFVKYLQGAPGAKKTS
ncbi:MAG: LysR family transcriptional regulator [Christensenellaceae bacterium]|jgi:DNA-binding transcriptional LysR family regulator|nr:LysR family transcriptional regulator [Christensenellaceae bacterium]